jgi:hypothetical protein
VFRPSFGFGGFDTAAAARTSISPTPAASGGPAIGRAVNISAPLTWSGVHDGCRARICAAAPATTGAAKDVPDIHMYPDCTIRSGNDRASVDSDGTGPVMKRPGATSSGFANPSGV